jgi:uncharacterized membrane protein
VRLALFLSMAVHLVTAPAMATQEFTPEPGWRYRVVGVAPDDTLNVREQPDPTSERVTTIAPDATDIAVTGIRIEAGGSVWWLIADADRREGWVNARYLTPMSTDAELETDYPLLCAGTEPFWSLDVRGEKAELNLPEGEPATWTATILPGPGAPPHRMVRLEAGGRTGHLAAFRTQQFCSDGMSDQLYPFEALLAGPDDEVRYGCCSRG